MRNIIETDVLLRTGAGFPAGLTIATEQFRDGWRSMRTGGLERLEKKLRTHGWNFLRFPDGLLRSGVGLTAQHAIAGALKLALRRVHPGCNAVQVERVEMTQYPWFFLARVRVYPYCIQQGSELLAPQPAMSDQAEPLPVRLRRLPTKTADRFPEFGSAMPFLKSMLIATSVVEVRAQ